ncbi:P-loop containing nucleoside triphosphate hydrolase protein [Phialemonium atrogriseum]|uniref:P-loop containing nucleoside triphosphate hydrolase protein n=1 Tax=Phialemonium atrogriseum TaxID=1093897 RepID=A0AAJ0FC97_9PEZI|nr:P-loop containing nucleoside triphosphate hydrolase protein [Phialemonium atrogriseum]KAK1761907.1 P-loop containing nucleoside triphosphate hydrolase protein [Phialemonium atrogriseum]
MADAKSAATTVGMVFQSFNLFAHKTILENVTLSPGKVHGLSHAKADKRGIELLECRVTIGQALAMQPKAMLFGKQPLTLNPDMINEVLDVMIELAHDSMAMVVITYDIRRA